MNRVRIICTAVSYTHLDVYKRQGIHYRIWAECSGTGQFRAGPQLCRLGIQSPGVHWQISVSYTHLYIHYMFKKYDNEIRIINVDALTDAGNLENLKRCV